MIFLNQIIQGVLLGGYYALIACGLSFMFGVMGVINLAHGSLAVLAAYALYVLADRFGVQPFLGLGLVIPLMALIGWALQRLVLERSARGGLLVPVLSTFGLSIILDNLLFQGFGADTRSLAPYIGDLSYDSWTLSDDISIGKLAALTMAVAIALLGGIQIFLNRTLIGRAIRATSEDPDTVGLVGVNARRVNAIAAAIALATVGGRRGFSRHARDVRPLCRSAAAHLRLRGVGDRRSRIALGHAHRRHRARRCAKSRRARQSARLLHRRPRRLSCRPVRAPVLRRPRPARPGRAHWGEREHERGQRRRRALDAAVAHRGRCGRRHDRRARGRTGRLQRQRRRQAHDAVHLCHSGPDVERAGRILRPGVDRPAGVLRPRRLCRHPSRRLGRRASIRRCSWARSSSAWCPGPCRSSCSGSRAASSPSACGWCRNWRICLSTSTRSCAARPARR